MVEQLPNGLACGKVKTLQVDLTSDDTRVTLKSSAVGTAKIMFF